MKKLLVICIFCLCANIPYAQITIMNEDVQEKIVSKPQAFDSLSNLTYQKDPIQYKKYIGYRLFCLPISNKFKCKGAECIFHEQDFKYKSNREFVLPHIPFAQTTVAMLFGDTSKLKGSALAQYKQKEDYYEKKYIVSTDIYNVVTVDSLLSDMPQDDLKSYAKFKLYTPYESIQNTYFTILNIEIAESIEAGKGQYTSLEEWDNRYNGISYLRFTLKNETSGEELYWIKINDESYLNNSVLFLVPYFEKMQKTYKDQRVVPTTKLERLVDINTGDAVTIQPGEVCQCYDVTFVNTKDNRFIKPFFILKKDNNTVMVPFQDFTKKCRGIFTEEDRTYRPTFLLEVEYNEVVAERKRAVEEQQRILEEKLQKEQQAQQERNKEIMQKYGSKYGTLICKGQVCLKMTKEMCADAWGNPLYVNSTIVNGLVHEQWVYWGSYLYFDNGVLTGIQN